jgi:hypothetical protein
MINDGYVNITSGLKLRKERTRVWVAVLLNASPWDFVAQKSSLVLGWNLNKSNAIEASKE